MPRVLLVNPANRQNLYKEFGWQPLSLACVAAATPPSWEVEILDEVIEPLTPDRLQVDLVGITAFTSQAPRAYEIAALARSVGTKVVVGGVHATFLPEEAQAHADAVVTGEAEIVWPALLRDMESGCLKRRYEGGRVAAGEGWPLVPRRDLLRADRYRCASTQTTRGCPLHCSFCSVTAFNGATYRAADAGWIVEEFRRIPERRVFVVDDNFVGLTGPSRARALRSLASLEKASLGKDWLTQVTIDFGEDEVMPRAASAAGCAVVFIGFESLRPDDLSAVSKRRATNRYRDCISRIRGAGIAIIGSFILGIDHQDITRTVDDTLAFIEQTGIDAFNPTLLTPLPGTRDFQVYRGAGRLLYDNFPADWEQFTLARPTVRPLDVSPARLYQEFLRWRAFFEPTSLLARAERTRRELGFRQAGFAYLWNRPFAAWNRRGVNLPLELPDS